MFPIYIIIFQKGIFRQGSDWVGFEHFATFMQSPMFWRLIKNTLSLSVYSLIAGFPLPILLALSLNYIKNARFKDRADDNVCAAFYIGYGAGRYAQCIFLTSAWEYLISF